MSAKYDYPPLLAPGRHIMFLADVKTLFVDPFPSHQRRLHLYQQFEQFVQEYLVAGIPCDVWLDGSFLTENPEPKDIDTSVMIEPAVEVDLTQSQHELIDRTNDAYFGPDVDAFAYILKERGDPDYADEELNPGRTWNETFGLEHSKQWLKGFGVLKLRENDVGLRICR